MSPLGPINYSILTSYVTPLGVYASSIPTHIWIFQLLLLFALVAYAYSLPAGQAAGPNEAVTNAINFKRQAGI